MEEKTEVPHSGSSQDGDAVMAPPSYHVQSTYIKPQLRKPHDPDVKFEEYYYYAKRSRQEEDAAEAPKTDWREIVLRKKKEGALPEVHSALTATDFENIQNRIEITDEEWTNASRAFRTASWGACEF